MGAKVTLKSVAELAGVGTATVERVLNGRGGVKLELVEKVIAAALKLDYPKRLPGRHHGILRIEVMLLQPELTFTTRITRSFERIGASLDRSIVIHRTLFKGLDPTAIAEQILNPESRRSALIVALPQHPLVRDALVKVLNAGMPVVQIVSPIEGLEAPFVGIDNVAAGRTAGQMMAALQPGRGSIAAICHSQYFGVHRERVKGFSEYLARQHNDRFAFSRVDFALDNAEEIARVALSMAEEVPDLAGIYAVGGDYGPLCAALQRLRPQRPICVVGHEINKQTTLALRQGVISAIIDQAPETQARRAIDTALYLLGILELEVETTPIRFITVTAENV